LKSLFVAFASTLAFANPGSVQDPTYPELPNFHKVDDKLYRGGQPAEGGVAKLKALGIRSIINLRYERDISEVEEAEAKAAGVRYYNVPMYGLARPDDAKVKRVLALINDPENQPAFVHCKRGCDRTGAIVACYRIESSLWTAQRSIVEAMAYGMYRAEWAKRAFIRDFYAQFQEAGKALVAAGATP
jgi:protein tyrosine/serine phosphatase